MLFEFWASVADGRPRLKQHKITIKLEENV